MRTKVLYTWTTSNLIHRVLQSFLQNTSSLWWTMYIHFPMVFPDSAHNQPNKYTHLLQLEPEHVSTSIHLKNTLPISYPLQNSPTPPWSLKNEMDKNAAKFLRCFQPLLSVQLDFQGIARYKSSTWTLLRAQEEAAVRCGHSVEL